MQLSKAIRNTSFIIEKVNSLELQSKLLELGFFEGSKIELKHKAPLKGPLSIQSKDVQVILRYEDAQNIEVNPV